jgi:DNA-binding beta-propeller fold protein YncE
MKTGSVWKINIGSNTATIIANAIGMPRGIAALADGRLALADYENHVVEILDPRTGVLSPLAGSFGVAGFAEGVGAAARFSAPYALVQRSDGKLVVVDQKNNRLRVVGLDGAVSTLAGTGHAGFADGAMATATFDTPEGLAMAGNGDLFVTDLGNFRVRRISASSSAVDTIAGDGKAGYIDDDDPLASEFYGLEGISVRPDASLVYVADGTRGDDVPFNRVRQIKMK